MKNIIKDFEFKNELYFIKKEGVFVSPGIYTSHDNETSQINLEITYDMAILIKH